MTVLELLQILGAVFALAKDGIDIAAELQNLGFKPTDSVPIAYLRKLADAHAAIPSFDVDKAWEENHENNGG